MMSPVGRYFQNWNHKSAIISLREAEGCSFLEIMTHSPLPDTQRHGVNNMEGNQLLIVDIFKSFVVFKDRLDKINIFSTMQVCQIPVNRVIF